MKSEGHRAQGTGRWSEDEEQRVQGIERRVLAEFFEKAFFM